MESPVYTCDLNRRLPSSFWQSTTPIRSFNALLIGSPMGLLSPIDEKFSTKTEQCICTNFNRNIVLPIKVLFCVM